MVWVPADRTEVSKQRSKLTSADSCHPIEPFRASWEGSSHEQAGVTCTDCHFDPGAFGYISGKLYSVMKRKSYRQRLWDRAQWLV